MAGKDKTIFMYRLISEFDADAEREANHLKNENPTWNNETIIEETMEWIDELLSQESDVVKKNLQEFLNKQPFNNRNKQNR